MNKIFKTTVVLGAISVLFLGCNEKTSEAKVVEKKPEVKTEQKVVLPKAKKLEQTKKPEVINMAKEASEVFNDVFKDTAKIGPNGKYMVIIFGTNTCPYCMKLKEDVFQSKDFQKRLKDDYSSYYLKTHENLRHKLYHEKEFMDVDTKTMISIYGVTGTPTIIFADKDGKAIIMVPGYMPPKQFLATMDFIESKKWEGKDRKNGEVYQALKDFYIDRGIIKK